MQCNIDHRGRRVRLIAGIVVMALALGLLIFAFFSGVEGPWPWIAGVCFVVSGAFMIMEGALGWCAIRAMGMRTPF